MSSTAGHIHAIVLAAGRSSRFGANKLLLPAGPGHTVGTRTVSAALAGVEGHVLVVLGRDADAVRFSVLRSCASVHPSATARLRFAKTVNHKRGFGYSISRGVATLGALHPSAAGAVLHLADQPLVSPAQISCLVDTFLHRHVAYSAVAAALNHRRRNPVVVAPDLLSKFRELSGGQGGRSILEAHREQVLLLDLGPGSWARDIDTWRDYASIARDCGWDQEMPPEFDHLVANSVSLAVRARLERAASSGTALAPGVVILPSGRELLDADGVPPERGRPATVVLTGMHRGSSDVPVILVLGNARTSLDRLRFLRHASLWALHKGTDASVAERA